MIKNGNTVYYKSYLTDSKKKSKKYIIIKETWKKKTKKITNYDNPYLKKSTKCEVGNTKIINVLKDKDCLGSVLYKTKGKGSKDNQVKKMDKIFKWVGKHVAYNKDSNYSALGVLSHKSSNGKYVASCVGYSNLIAAMCRSAGIPVKYKLITLFRKSISNRESSLGHAYLFVYLKNKWTAVDGTSSDINKYNESAWAEDESVAKTITKYMVVIDNRHYDKFELNCNHYLNKHRDSNINFTNNPNNSLINYFVDYSSKINSSDAASSFLKSKYDNYKYDNICLAIPGSYVNGNLYYSGKLFSKSIWAFHTFKNVNNEF